MFRHHPYRRRHSGTVACHDCGAQVAELKTHRIECSNSKLNKAKLVNRTTAAAAVATGNVLRVGEGVDFYALLDVSGSMGGARLDNAKKVMTEFFETLKDEDRLSIITFDTGAFFKLKPRPVGQVRRQNELGSILGRIRAGGNTALYDAIYLAVDQLRDKHTKKTFVNVLTDGEDNSSTHTLAQVRALVDQCPGVTLNIVHIDDQGHEHAPYQELCRNRGEYIVIQETQIVTVLTRIYKSCI